MSDGGIGLAVTRRYQSHEGDDPGMSDSPLKAERLRLPRDLTGKRVLDIGCNEGYFCALAVSRGAARVVGIDVDAAALGYAQGRYGDLPIEFIHSGWDRIPQGPFDLVLWTSAMHYELDPHAVFTRLREELAPGATVILECGVSYSPMKEMVLHQRHSDSRWYPSQSYLIDVILRDFAVRQVTAPYKVEGDPVMRSVFHCKVQLPTVVLVRGGTMQGKTALATLVHADKTVSLDHLVSRIGASEYQHTPLERFMKAKLDTESLGTIYYGIDGEGLTEDFASLIAEVVAASDRLVVIDGPLSDTQVTALERRLAGRAFIWDTVRTEPGMNRHP